MHDVAHRRRLHALALGVRVEQTWGDPAALSDNELQKIEPDAETREQAIRQARRTLRRAYGRGHRRRPPSDLRRTVRARSTPAAFIGLRSPRPRAPRPRRTRSRAPRGAEDPGPGRPARTRSRGPWGGA